MKTTMCEQNEPQKMHVGAFYLVTVVSEACHRPSVEVCGRFSENKIQIDSIRLNSSVFTSINIQIYMANIFVEMQLLKC